jgi:hypothetical protein
MIKSDIIIPNYDIDKSETFVDDKAFVRNCVDKFSPYRNCMEFIIKNSCSTSNDIFENIVRVDFLIENFEQLPFTNRIIFWKNYSDQVTKHMFIIHQMLEDLNIYPELFCEFDL